MEYQEAMDKALWAAEHDKDPAPWLAIAKEMREAAPTAPNWWHEPRNPVVTATVLAQRDALQVELGKARTAAADLMDRLQTIPARVADQCGRQDVVLLADLDRLIRKVA